MSQKIKTICLVLITLAILSAVGFYCWSVYERQVYFERDEMFRKNLECQKIHPSLLYSGIVDRCVQISQ